MNSNQTKTKIKNKYFINDDYSVETHNTSAKLVLLLILFAGVLIWPGIFIGLIFGYLIGRFTLYVINQHKTRGTVAYFICVGVVFLSLLGLSIFWFCDSSTIVGGTSYMYAPLDLVFMWVETQPKIDYVYSILAMIVPITIVVGIILTATYDTIQKKLIVHNETLHRRNEAMYLKNQLDNIEKPSIIIEILRMAYGYSKALQIAGVEKSTNHKKRISWSNGAVLNADHLIPKKAFPKNILIVGANGSGKTNTILVLDKYFIKNHLKTIFVDMKGSQSLINEYKKMAKQMKFKFKYFETFSNNTDPDRFVYDPFKNKPANEIVSLILENSNYSSSLNKAPTDSQYYKEQEKFFLDFYVRLIKATVSTISLKALNDYCTPEEIDKRLACLFQKDKEQCRQLQQLWKIFMPIVVNPKTGEAGYDRDKCRTIETCRLKMFSFSNGSPNIRASNALGIADLIHGEADVVLFSINSMKDPVNAKLFGRMVVNDIKQNNDENLRGGKKTALIFDEFNVIADSANIDLINKGREYLFCSIISIQTLADIESVSPGYKDQIMSNTNTLIVHKVSDVKASDELGKSLLLGKAVDRTFQSEMTEAGEPDKLGLAGTYAVTDKFIIDPNLIRQLPTGHCCIRTLDDQGSEVITYKEPIKVDLFTK